jgi:hypothetical protein
LRKKRPNYTLTTDGIVIDFGWGARHLIYVGFAEINDLRCFTPDDADAFLRYQVGPDVPDFAASEKEIYHFLRGETTRPDRLFIGRTDPVGTTVLMKGRRFFTLSGSFGPTARISSTRGTHFGRPRLFQQAGNLSSRMNSQSA